MSTILIVALFLPSTISFDDASVKESQSNELNPAVHRRARSAAQLHFKASQLGISDDKLDELTQAFESTLSDNLFTPLLDTDRNDLQRKFLTPGSHVIARNDGYVPEWGTPVFNQPRSRAGPLPSASIHEFTAIRNEANEVIVPSVYRPSSTPPISTRAHTPDTEYEGKKWTVEPAVHGNGGLVNAVRGLKDNNEDLSITWIGTLGSHTDALAESLKHDIADRFVNEYHSEVVFLSDKDYDGHYAHYCRTILWPIFHYQVPDHVKSKAYADHSWEFYRNVNRAVADKVIASYKRGDTIWIHDYHLLLVPLMVREKYADAKIGFFLHLGFPSSEIFRCLAKRKELLDGMLGADLIVFQIEEYATHFLQTCSRLLTVETTIEGVWLSDRFVNVAHHAIGINPPLFEKVRFDDDVKREIQHLTERFRDKRVMVARDKLDNVHGVRQKLLAYELFLKKYPQWANKVILVQLATFSHDQNGQLGSVTGIVDRIDKAHTNLTQQPLLFLKQEIPFSTYIALLTVADVLIVSPLRDGMNLTPHDFICLQDGKGSNRKHGPLILSEFAGSASVLGPHPLIINPWDHKKHANAMNRALEMTDEEKELRWIHLHDIVLKQTGPAWLQNINETLARVCDEHQQRSHASVPRLSFVQLGDKYRTSRCRLFILDYEGTLAPHKTGAGIALGSPERVKETLTNLLMDPANIVYVMSGQSPDEMEGVFRTLRRIGLIAENGCFIRPFGTQNTHWTSCTDAEEVHKWKSEVRNILEYWQERIEESSIEDRLCSLLFHYDRSPDQDSATRSVGECIEQINGACKSLPVRAVPISKAILIEPEDVSKSTAAKHIFNALVAHPTKSLNPDFLMVAGNDREDETVFRWANDLGKDGAVDNVFTVTVSSRNTEAQASLTQGSTGMRTVLERLANISAEALPRDYFNIPFHRNKSFPG